VKVKLEICPIEVVHACGVECVRTLSWVRLSIILSNENGRAIGISLISARGYLQEYKYLVVISVKAHHHYRKNA
jgi:hypothetical protein